MINDRFFITISIMMLVPFIVMMVIPDPTTSTIITIGTNLGIVFYLRRTMKNTMSGTGLFGGKMKFSCIVCQGTKFDSKGSCVRCGSRQRRPI